MLVMGLAALRLICSVIGSAVCAVCSVVYSSVQLRANKLGGDVDAVG